MARLVPLLALTALAACQDEPGGEGIAVPSGRELSLIEVLTDVAGTEGAVARFRFLAPGLTQDEAETAAVDMQALCDGFALGRVEGMVPAPQQEANTVVSVLQKGYLIAERVLRPALVTVAAPQ